MADIKVTRVAAQTDWLVVEAAAADIACPAAAMSEHLQRVLVARQLTWIVAHHADAAHIVVATL